MVAYLGRRRDGVEMAVEVSGKVYRLSAPLDEDASPDARACIDDVAGRIMKWCRRSLAR